MYLASRLMTQVVQSAMRDLRHDISQKLIACRCLTLTRIGEGMFYHG